jgi:lysophospholipid acyltransferase (LPLAT)-like uncharacterized protein
MGRPEPLPRGGGSPDASLDERKHSPSVRLVAWLVSLVLRMLKTSWRIDIEGIEHLQQALAGSKKALAVFWHGKYIPLFPLLAGYSACVFSSASFRGDVIAEVARRFGFRACQIADGGHEDSFELMRRALSRSRAGAIAVDGPLGPRHEVHSGAMRLASELGFVLLPVSMDAVRKHVQEARWDRIEIPLPMTRLFVVIGECLSVPAALTLEDTAQWKTRLRAELDALDRRAEQKVAMALRPKV